MTILLLTHSYPDEPVAWRGMFIREQAMALSREHEVIVVYFKVDYSHFGPFSKYSFIKRNNGPIVEYTLTTARSFPVITQWKYLADTYRFIEREVFSGKKIDIIHSHLSYPAGFLGTILQRRKKIPNVVTEHSWITNYFRSRIHKISVRYTLKNACAVVAVSSTLSKNIRAFYDREITVIPNVVNVDAFSVHTSRGNGKLNIGLLGGMNNNLKGIDILLNAVALTGDLNLTVHIGGTGKLLDDYKSLAARFGITDKCIFYGEIKHENKSAFYSGLDVYIMASRRETFGVVVVEAMASGLPIIATRCGGPEEIVTTSTGILIDKENPAELANAIREISVKLKLYNADAIRGYAVSGYSPEKVCGAITALYHTILDKGKN
jgi:glycosyltransferase involved in cell wall biosynthesis